jgi:hypothetical protein
MSIEKKSGNGGILASDNEIAYYPLPAILPLGHVLVLNKRRGLLSYLAPAEATNWPRLLGQEQLSANEMRVLIPLLDHYPDYCPYEAVWASFYTGQTTTEAIDRARLRLQEAQFANVWDHEVKPIRNILSRVRFKLRSFSIDIRSIMETGYLLKPLAREASNVFSMHFDK